MKNTIKLSVHKNTLQKRKEKDLRKEMMSDTKMMSHNNMIGYCMVAWGKDGSTVTSWDYDNTDSPIRSTFLGLFVKDTIQRRISKIDMDDKLNE